VIEGIYIFEKELKSFSIISFS